MDNNTKLQFIYEILNIWAGMLIGITPVIGLMEIENGCEGTYSTIIEDSCLKWFQQDGTPSYFAGNEFD